MKAQNKKDKLLNKKEQPKIESKHVRSRDINRQSLDLTAKHHHTSSANDSNGLLKSKKLVTETLQGKQNQYRNALNTEEKYNNLLHSKMKPTDKGIMAHSKILRKDTEGIKEKLKSQKNDLKIYSNVPKRELLQAKTDKKELLLEGISNQQTLTPKEARREAKSNLKVTQKEYKLMRSEVKKESNTLKNAINNEKNLSKEELKRLRDKKIALNRTKMNVKVNKKLVKHSVNNDPFAVRNQVKTESKARIKQDLINKTTSPVKQDDTFGEAINLVQQTKQANMQMRQALKVTKLAGKLSMKTAKGSYGLGNKTYNLVRGKGFYRTPPHLTTRAELMKKARRSKRRLMAYSNQKKFQFSFEVNKMVSQASKALSTAVKAVATNPITLSVLGFILICLVVVGIASGNQYAISQTEEDLTDSWAYMTKLDTDHNDDSNTFYTNFNDVMFYMNYRFEDYQLDEKYSLTKTYRKYLSTMWSKLNGSSPNYEIVSMDSLIKNKKSSYYLNKEDYSEYKENKSEYGYLSLDGQLSFPFKAKELTVTRRFGYEGKGKNAKLFNQIIVKSEPGTDIVAPMSGTVSKITGTDSIEIKLSKDHKIILKGVNNSRFIGGETITEGAYIGKGTDATLSIKYFSYQSEEAKWKAVNPAFYFPKVIYTQETLLGSDYDSMSLSPQVISLIPKFKQAMKEVGMPEKYLPIVLAVCMQESAGLVPDVMQCSESLGLPRNTLGTDASIKQGVRYLWGNMKLVGLELINRDDKYVKTAVQAYNYGVNFIPYTKSNNYAFTEELATGFAMMMSGGTGGYGDSKYVAHVWRYVSSGGQKNPGNGQFSYPLPNRLASISGFDYRINPKTGVAEFHTGLDFAVGFGTEVYAAEDAVVMRATDVGDTYGINVVLKHKKGNYWTRYAHLSKAMVSENGTVKKGQLIGLVGSTGLSTGPHLHFEVMTSMYAGHVDPRGFIK